MKTFAEVVATAEKHSCPIWEIVLDEEERELEIGRSELWQKMRTNWLVMCDSINAGLEAGTISFSGMVGNEGAKLSEYLAKGKSLSGDGALMASARALGVAGVNACMGKIVAAPTAGSCGILPSVLMTSAERTGASEDKIIGALFTAAGVGKIIDAIATTSGAQGGCQAECGAASCMAAVAVVEMAGGTPTQAAHAGAIALKNTLGLVCDPVAGLVEVPCVKRNAMGAANALLSADMALAGIESNIPIDEVIAAMKEVGDALPTALKETARGGLANTPTAREIESRVLK